MKNFKKIVKIIFSTIGFVILSGITSILLFVVLMMLFSTVADKNAIKGIPGKIDCNESDKNCEETFIKYFFENETEDCNTKIKDIKGNTIFVSNGINKEFLLDNKNNILSFYWPDETHHMSRAIYNKNNEMIMEMGNKVQGYMLWVNEYIRK